MFTHITERPEPYHTDTCRRETAKSAEATSAFDQQFPDHCKKCHGAGALYYSDDPSASGVSLSPGSMEFCDPCPACVEKGICPRCGKMALDEEGDHCWCCSWTFEEEFDEVGNRNYRPAEYECFCWEALDAA